MKATHPPTPALISVFALALAGSVHAQSAPPPAPAGPPAAKEEVVALSPFVISTDAIGYFALNTMSGTRLNTKLEDLASSTTVITKQQMSDFAMLDINDIFNYEASTEGTGNYTNLSVNQGGTPIDGVQLDPQASTRIRGLSAPSISLGNFETSGRMPIDPLSVDAVEINRGPNSSVFGIGGLAGSVNAVPASANLARNRSEVAARLDSESGYRTALDLNRVLLPNVLAVRGSAVVQRDGYSLKPSGMSSVRLNGMVKYRPFARTTITGSYTHYQTGGNRPNATTPQSSLAQWQKDGSPTWNPVTRIVTADGRAPAAFPTALPTAFFQTRGYTAGITSISTDPNGPSYWTVGYSSATANPTVASGTGQYLVNRDDQTYAGKTLVGTTALNPPVADKGVYDWSRINLGAPNYYNDKTVIYNVTVDQNLVDTPRHSLALQIGWLRENDERLTGKVVGVANSVGDTLYVDPNERFFDGTANPNFKRPFLAAEGVQYTSSPLDRDAYRGQLAYRLDLRQERGGGGAGPACINYPPLPNTRTTARAPSSGPRPSCPTTHGIRPASAAR